jgi:hypothetical protein
VPAPNAHARSLATSTALSVKARKATLLARMAGEQPAWSLAEARAAFWKRTGKP